MREYICYTDFRYEVCTEPPLLVSGVSRVEIKQSCKANNRIQKYWWANMRDYWHASNNVCVLSTLDCVVTSFGILINMPPLYFVKIQLNIILLSASRALQTVQIFIGIAFVYDACYIPFPSQPQFDCLNTILLGSQIMKLFIIGLQLYKASCHFHSLRSKYSAEHPVYG